MSQPYAESTYQECNVVELNLPFTAVKESKAVVDAC